MQVVTFRKPSYPSAEPYIQPSTNNDCQRIFGFYRVVRWPNFLSSINVAEPDQSVPEGVSRENVLEIFGPKVKVYVVEWSDGQQFPYPIVL